jgi:hypothetical protein
MDVHIDLTHISKKNLGLQTRLITVANGAAFKVLDLTEEDISNAENVIYMHVNDLNLKCYIGITVQRAKQRWTSGIAYKNNRLFGSALKKHGWHNFSSYILAFGDDRESLNNAEVLAISTAGGHKSKDTYNLSPGGDMVAENDIPIVGIYLETGKEELFKSGADAARKLKMKNPDMPMAVVRKERKSVAGWWFRAADDLTASPPESWGESYRISQVQAIQGKAVIAINYKTREEKRFDTAPEAAAFLDVTHSLVSMVARGEALSANGWWIKFEDSESEMPAEFGSTITRKKRDRKVYAISLKTGDRQEFRNCTVADESLNLHKGAAAAVASKERTSTTEWWFTFSPTEQPPSVRGSKLVAIARSKAVIATHIESGLDTRFESAKAAGEALGVHRSAISQVIKGKSKSAKGFSFRFEKPKG